MNGRRILALFAAFIAGFTILQARLFVLMSENPDGEAEPQSLYRATVAVHRPNFYDRTGSRMTGAQSTEYAVIYPGDEADYRVLAYVDVAEIPALTEQIGGSTPFLVPLQTEPDGSFETVSIEQRYASRQSAAHLIGYLDYEGRGVSGLEAAFEDYFSEFLTRTVLETEVNAQGAAIRGADVRVYEDAYHAAGVQLTVDLRLQRLCEQVADEMIHSGAVVLLDSKTGEIRASVSRPDFDPANLAASLDEPDAPLLNKAMTAYNVGSIYKPVIAACALEAGIDGSFTHVCTGSITVDGQTYSCNNGVAHGEMDMQQALIHSCNTYFIALGQQLGAQAVYNAACAVGANRRLTLAQGYATARASMPTLAELESGGELCNHCFGQGRLLLTPLHVAAMTNALACGGLYRPPVLVKAIGGEEQPPPTASQIFDKEAAETVARYLASVVDGGTGSNAMPALTTAAGKTGTAQTGLYNEDGTERVVGWFTGWFPADNPRYTLAIMTDDEGYGFESAAPVFARIADEITARGY